LLSCLDESNSKAQPLFRKKGLSDPLLDVTEPAKQKRIIQAVNFLEYLREDLIPALRVGDIVVMDNLRARHTKEVEELLRSVGVVPLYLPSYSPNLNPIEKMWSKKKDTPRKFRFRSAALLSDAVPETLAAISCSDCDSWFRCAGY